jgi:teichuronic acid biosynthesis glycosyltransferase TuaC
VIEAMLCGRALVASAAGGTLEIVRDGENGALFEPGDADGLAVRIQGLLSDPALRAGTGAAARRFALEKLTLGAMLEKVAACVEEAIPARAGIRAASAATQVTEPVVR